MITPAPTTVMTIAHCGEAGVLWPPPGAHITLGRQKSSSSPAWRPMIMTQCLLDSLDTSALYQSLRIGLKDRKHCYLLQPWLIHFKWLILCGTSRFAGDSVTFSEDGSSIMHWTFHSVLCLFHLCKETFVQSLVYDSWGSLNLCISVAHVRPSTWGESTSSAFPKLTANAHIKI